MRQERIWVHPSFKKRIKKEAIEKDMSMLQLTKKLGEEYDEFLRRFDKYGKKEKLFKI